MPAGTPWTPEASKTYYGKLFMENFLLACGVGPEISPHYIDGDIQRIAIRAGIDAGIEFRKAWLEKKTCL
jgi:hypothetical protein